MSKPHEINMEHTPGPWRVGDAGRTVFGPPNGNPAPEVVATIHGGTSDQAAITRVFTMKANARLIACAPELLEALKACLASMERDNWESDQPAIRQTRAAIAKASTGAVPRRTLPFL